MQISLIDINFTYLIPVNFISRKTSLAITFKTVNNKKKTRATFQNINIYTTCNDIDPNKAEYLFIHFTFKQNKFIHRFNRDLNTFRETRSFQFNKQTN